MLSHCILCRTESIYTHYDFWPVYLSILKTCVFLLINFQCLFYDLIIGKFSNKKNLYLLKKKLYNKIIPAWYYQVLNTCINKKNISKEKKIFYIQNPFTSIFNTFSRVWIAKSIWSNNVQWTFKYTKHSANSDSFM